MPEAHPPKFFGASLREARESREITATALSEIVGVTKAAISQYENGKQQPRPEVLERICRALNVPRAFFYSERPESSSILFFRSMASSTLRSRKRAARRVVWCYEIARYLENFIEFPKPNFPDSLNRSLRSITLHEVELQALNLRKRWAVGHGPISNLVWLCENNGVVVTRWDLGTKKIDAFSCWPPHEKHPHIVLGSDKGSACRSRFDCAHELGHLILHRSQLHSQLENNHEFKLMESQAHRFASAFLFPASAFRQEFKSPRIKDLLPLKKRWKMSLRAIVKRAEDLGILSRSKAKSAWIQLSPYKTSEPLDSELKPEEPHFLPNGFKLLLESGTQTPAEVKLHLPFSPSDISAISGISPEMLIEANTPISPVPPKLKSSSTKPRNRGGKVIAFPHKS